MAREEEPVRPDATPQRRAATAAEAKAIAHPVRMRMVRACRAKALTNKELADLCGVSPASALYHVRLLVAAGFLAPVEQREGPRGSTEKPYRSTGLTWWLDDPLGDQGAAARAQPVHAVVQELQQAGPESIATFATLLLHLDDAQVAELDRRILAVLDEYVLTDAERVGSPTTNVLMVMHRVD